MSFELNIDYNIGTCTTNSNVISRLFNFLQLLCVSFAVFTDITCFQFKIKSETWKSQWLN